MSGIDVLQFAEGTPTCPSSSSYVDCGYQVVVTDASWTQPYSPQGLTLSVPLQAPPGHFASSLMGPITHYFSELPALFPSVPDYRNPAWPAYPSVDVSNASSSTHLMPVYNDTHYLSSAPSSPGTSARSASPTNRRCKPSLPACVQD